MKKCPLDRSHPVAMMIRQENNEGVIKPESFFMAFVLQDNKELDIIAMVYPEDAFPL